MAVALPEYDWIIALITIAFCASAFGNGANDVANSYATSVAARTLTMPQVGILAACTEFIGAVALGSRVTGTIKNDIIDINHFADRPPMLMLAMGCAEFGSAFWLIFATKLGFPVSTTQTIVGALVGVGIASRAAVSWAWEDGSVSQVAASWGIAPLVAGAFSAILFGTIKYLVLERKDSFKWAMRLIPWYLAFTGGVLALFITIEAPGLDSLEELGAGNAVAIVLGTFFGCLAISYIFFVPYFHRRLVRQDPRVRAWHIPLGPMLLKDDCPLYLPGKGGDVVTDYYESAHIPSCETASSSPSTHPEEKRTLEHPLPPNVDAEKGNNDDHNLSTSSAKEGSTGQHESEVIKKPTRRTLKPEPEERWLAPVVKLPIYHPHKLLNYVKFGLFQGVSRDCVTYSSVALANTHAKAKRYDNRVEHLWTYAQVVSAMMMSIAHGSNDVANAVGPWVAAYGVWRSGEVNEDSDTPIWILVVAGILLGAGFWFFGYHIIRSLGNRITQMSPTRGFSMELGAAIAVLLASRLGLPVSTTQCLTGSVVGVALMNYDLAAVNWRQIAFIAMGWILTLPVAGLLGGLLMGMAENTPNW